MSEEVINQTEEVISQKQPEEQIKETNTSETLNETEEQNKETIISTESTEEEIKETLKEKGINYQELLEEYADKGDLSEETLQKLDTLGFTKEFVNDFINGKKALIEQQVKREQEELASYVGGQETFDNIIKWAADNISNEEKLVINSIKDITTQKLILEGLKARMEQNEGVLPTYIQGSGQEIKSDIFESQAQMFEAIRDKRYKTDPAYQEAVTKRIEASRKAGIDLGI